MGEVVNHSVLPNKKVGRITNKWLWGPEKIKSIEMQNNNLREAVTSVEYKEDSFYSHTNIFGHHQQQWRRKQRRVYDRLIVFC